MSTRAEAERLVTAAGIPQDAPTEPAGSTVVRPAFPQASPDMFYGLTGEIVEALDPYTEACKPAVLATLLSGCGAMIGRGPHMEVGFVRHPPSVWGLLVGGTALGAKGTADAAARLILKEVDQGFMTSRVLPSLSTGEGLIHQVRDASDKEDKDGVPIDEGVNDKRLFIVVPEFRTVIAQGKRDSNTLTPVLRSAWDSADVLSVPNRTDNGYRATEAHIVMMAHVTPGEFRKKMDPAEIAGGTLNRYLIIASRESKDLANPQPFPGDKLHDFGKRLRERIEAARALRNRRIAKTEAAQQLWFDNYRALKNPTGARNEEEEGLVASVVTRARPHVLRVALTYALLDGREIVDREHLVAALAMWRYSLDSARWLFRDYGVDPEVAKLRVFLDEAGERGRSREEITDVCFSKHATNTPLDELLAQLGDDYEEYKMRTGGRPRMMYRRKVRGGSGESGESR